MVMITYEYEYIFILIIQIVLMNYVVILFQLLYIFVFFLGVSDLQSGHLLVSLKSQCHCCGKEMVDPHKVPDDFIAHGIHIPVEEFEEALLHLMSDNKFHCHVWCYNVPAALLFFTILLGLCLTVIPIVETEYIFHRKETGLEFLHAGIAWLCVLTAYMIIIHISKKKVRRHHFHFKLFFLN